MKTEKQLLITTEEGIERRVVNWLTYTPPAGEVNTLPSMTQPNDVMSVKEVLDRFTRGLPLNSGDIGYYDDPDGMDMSDFDMMDKFEKEDFIREQREFVNELQRRYDEEQKDSQKDTDAQHPVNSSAAQQQESARSETGRKSAPDTSDSASPAR